MVSRKKIKRLELKEKKISNVIDEIIFWCVINLGESKYHDEIPNFYVCYELEDKTIAEYDFDENEIIIYILNINTIKELVTNVIHEYIHYLQPKNWYTRFFNKLEKKNNIINYNDYFTHPYEFEAKMLSELETDYCMKDLKFKNIKI